MFIILDIINKALNANRIDIILRVAGHPVPNLSVDDNKTGPCTSPCNILGSTPI